jgi:hypothetical protein
MEVVKFMKKAILAILFILAVAGFVMAQTYVSPTDVLGAHNNNGRGCAGCHAPHSGAFGSGHTPIKNASDAGSYALWGQDASPLYGASIAFGDSGKYVEVLPGTITGGGTEVSGILLCLSCHDGNVTYSNMMLNYSYEQRLGLLTNTAYGAGHIPTLLGNDGTTAGNYTNDHPVGLNATLFSYGCPIQGCGQGVAYTNNVFVVTPGTAYGDFVNNYGYPALAPGKWEPPYGISTAGVPYVACTTCHNQHVMTVYTASTSSPIAGSTTGSYATWFFVNGPYNVNNMSVPATSAPSTTQFCRQCHFDASNEATGAYNIPTAF